MVLKSMNRRRFIKIIAGMDYMLADSEAARLVDIRPVDIGYIQKASNMNLGNMEVDQKFIVRETI